MTVEANYRFIDDLDPSLPADNDFLVEGDDHLNGIKAALQGSVQGDADSTGLRAGGGNPVTVEAVASGAVITGTATQSAAATLATELLRKGEADTALALKIDLAGGAFTGVVTGIAATGATELMRKGEVDAADATLQGNIDGKANTVHTHVIADTTGLQTALDGKAAVVHVHTISDVTGLQAALDAKAATTVTDSLQTQIDNLINGTTKFTGAQEAPDFTAV